MNYALIKRAKKPIKGFIVYFLFTILVLGAIIITAYALTERSLVPAASTTVVLTTADGINNPVELECSAEPSTARAVLEETPVLFTEINYESCYNNTFSESFIVSAEKAIVELKSFIDSGNYSEAACTTMNNEVIRLTTLIDKAKLEISTIESWKSEYKYATETWLYFKQRGYSDAVICAIIGNMMTETSGGSLAIKPVIYDPSGGYYGLCQWSLYYKPEVANMSFEDQLEYLYNDIAKEFKTFGSCYKAGFTLEAFLAMDDPEEAALAFAKVYERCASFSYSKRKVSANIAYEYFNLNVSD